MKVIKEVVHKVLIPNRRAKRRLNFSVLRTSYIGERKVTWRVNNVTDLLKSNEGFCVPIVS